MELTLNLYYLLFIGLALNAVIYIIARIKQHGRRHRFAAANITFIAFFSVLILSIVFTRWIGPDLFVVSVGMIFMFVIAALLDKKMGAD